MTTTLHISAEHVSAMDLTERRQASMSDPGGDLVSLTLGDDHTKVVLLGSLAALRSILGAASSHLDDIGINRLSKPDEAPQDG